MHILERRSMIFIVFPFTGESHPMTKGATVAKKAKSSEGANKAQFIRDALDKLGIDAQGNRTSR